MSDLDTLKQQVTEMQAEIERLEAKEREHEIPVGTLCWFWDNGFDGKKSFGAYAGISGAGHKKEAGITWMNARIANDIPGVMIWEKHDGGPCPVDGGTRVLQMFRDSEMNEGIASAILWQNVTAYAIINKAEWME